MAIKKTSERKRTSDGSGSIRFRESDQRYEGRVVVGYDANGKIIRKSVYGKSEKEVRDKITIINSKVISGTYIEPSKITVSDWMNQWIEVYCNGVKETTKTSYMKNIKNHIIPHLGKKKLKKLTPTEVQRFYNSLQTEISTSTNKPLSTKTIKNIHGLLHKALKQAVCDGLIASNPSDNRIIKKNEKKETVILDQKQISAFLQASSEKKYDDLFKLTLFTGMRLSEVVGLTWDCIDFNEGTIHIYRQLQKLKGGYEWTSLKSSKPRSITPPASVMDLLLHIKEKQDNHRKQAGPIWSNNDSLVFTNEIGKHYSHANIRKHFKDIAAEIGMPDLRFHDLRHTFATMSIYAGNDIKMIQSNLGHYSSAFTMDTYAHVTKKMQQTASDKLQDFIDNL